MSVMSLPRGSHACGRIPWAPETAILAVCLPVGYQFDLEVPGLPINGVLLAKCVHRYPWTKPEEPYRHDSGIL